MSPGRLSRRRAAAWLGASLLAPRVQAQSLAAPAAPAQARWLPWPPERPRPELQLPDWQGRDWSLAQEAGHALLLNFWASWCEPCRAEMASFERLQQQFGPQRLRVVGVNFKEGQAVVQRFRDSQAPTLALVRDAYGEATRAWGVRSLPTTFVINPAGRVLLQVEGELDWSSSAVHQRLQSVL